MNKKFLWTIVFLIVIGGLVYLVFREPKKDLEEEVDSRSNEEEAFVGEEEEVEEAFNFSLFSGEDQVLGEESTAEFEIRSMEESSGDGYHEVIFFLKSESVEEPYVLASYSVSSGVVRVDFRGISGDSSGIGYQKEKRIDKEGVLRIYHNVSARSDQELYDIGVSGETVFRLASENMENGGWKIILQVKYPGESSVDIDLGSEEFSSSMQEIVGIGSKKNARVTGYSYSGSSGLMKLVWGVSGDGDCPIPSVTASYNGENELVVVFESLVLDRVASSTTMELPSGIKGVSSRDGERSVYVFSGLGGQREFKLSASVSPNQVILEIN